MTDNGKKDISSKKLLFQYAGMGAQIVAGLIIAVAVGYWIDKKTKISFPVFIWLLPLIAIIGMILKIFKDTSKK